MRRLATPDWDHVGWVYKGLHAFPAPQHNRLFVRVKGMENVPASGAAVVASNHCSWWDPVVLNTVILRPLAWLGKREAMANRFTRWFFVKQGGAIPVDRSTRNPDAYAAAIDALRGGRLLAVFPEATRHQGPLGPAKTGAARLALEAGVPVLPVGLAGDAFWPIGRKTPRWREKIYIRVGEPMRLEGDAKSTSDARRETDRIMRRVGELLDEARAAQRSRAAWARPE